MSGAAPAGAAPGATAPAHSLLTLDAEFGRADELDLGEMLDPLARQIPPRAARRGRVNDDRHAGVRQELGRIGQGPVEDLFLGRRRPPLSHQGAPGAGQVEDLDGPGP